MRVIAEIPHEVMKITVFSWNEKYLLKFELGQFEQTYKIGVMDVENADELKNLVSEEFSKSVFQRFLSMRNDFTQSWKSAQNN